MHCSYEKSREKRPSIVILTLCRFSNVTITIVAISIHLKKKNNNKNQTCVPPIQYLNKCNCIT